jgi:hypothetical protein
MRRTLLRLLVLLPAVFSTLLWIRSFSFRDSIYFSTPSWGGVFDSTAGAVGHGGGIWTSSQAWSIQRVTIPTPDTDWLDPQFASHISSGADSWYFAIPDWLITVMFGMPALIFLIFTDGRRRREISPKPPNTALEPTPTAP